MEKELTKRPASQKHYVSFLSYNQKINIPRNLDMFFPKNIEFELYAWHGNGTIIRCKGRYALSLQKEKTVNEDCPIQISFRIKDFVLFKIH